MGVMGFCTRWAIDARHKGPEWIEVVEKKLKLPGVGKNTKGLKIIQISDLHCSTTVSSKYLEDCVERINRLEADVICLTGDYITHDLKGKFRKKIVDILGNLDCRFEIYACMGNHDYGIDGILGTQREYPLRKMMEMMSRKGIRVLRNDAEALQIGDETIWFVGLGDLWARDLHPAQAFSKVQGNGIVIALAHNPYCTHHIGDYHYDVMMSGHTHGAPLQFSPSLSKNILNKLDYHAGMYHIGERKLYVNRGLGRLGRAFFNARPEITVFTLARG